MINYNNNLNNLANVDSQALTIERDQLQQHLFHLQQAKQTLTCPSCKIGLKLDNNILILNNNIISGNNKLNSLDINNKIKNIDLQLQQQAQRKALEQQLNEIVIPKDLDFNTVIDLDTVEQQLAAIKAVADIKAAPAFTVAEVEKAIKFKDLNQQLTNLKLNNIDIPNINIANIDKQLKTVKTSIMTNQKLQLEWNQRQQLQLEVDQLRSQMSKMENSENELKNAENELNSLQQQHQLWLYIDKLVLKQQQIDMDKVKLDKIKNGLANWIRLKDVMINEEYHALEQTVDMINSSLFDVMPLLFNDLSCKINLFKTNKTNNQVKAQVNLVFTKVSADGQTHELESIGSLSTGMKRRLNMALTLALRAITKTLWLMLDEVFASLNSTLCDSARQALEQHLSSVPGCCYVIHHHDKIGSYDNALVIT